VNSSTLSLTPAAKQSAPRSPKSQLMRRFLRNRNALLGTSLLLLLLLAALIGIWYTPYDPVAIDASIRLQPPSAAHLLGTDHFGRDIFSRILAGAHLSLAIGIVSVGIAVLFGILLGLPAGYLGGWADMLIMRAMDVLLAFPSVLMALGIVATLGASLLNVMIAVAISSVPIFTRLVRASTLSLRNTPFIEAAQVVGSSPLRIVGLHILPNILAPLIVLVTLSTASAILIGSALSFLGLGPQPPTPEWGAILSEARNYIRLGWWLTVCPGLAIAITVLALNLLGDGLRDVLDHRLE
jgi:peptide/nickel transport system permease protein